MNDLVTTQRAVDALFTPGLPLRDRVLAFEAFTSTHPQVPIPVKHEFIDGLYKREIIFPKGTLATGKIHPTDHMDVMLEGAMLVATEDGIKRIDAPCTLVSRAGHKKAGIALERTRWISYHPTSATTVEEVEAEIFCDSYDDIELTTSYTNVTRDNESYKEVIASVGMTEQQVQEQVQNPADQIPMPSGYEVEVFDSPIHGKGLYSCKDFKAGELIAPARIAGMRTPAGRYTNHSTTPNAVMRVESDGDVNLYALRDITLEELTTDYAHTLGEILCQV